MNKCTACDVNFNDGAHCTVCGKHYDFGCANITEAGYRKLGVNKRASWRCPGCRALSPAPPLRTATLESIVAQLDVMSAQLAAIPKLTDGIGSMRQEMVELRKACDFTSSKIDEVGKRLDVMDAKVSELECVRSGLLEAKACIAALQMEGAARDQWSRMNNVEIKGVPIKKAENLFDTVNAIGVHIGYKFPNNFINYISRIPVHNSKDKSILVGFVNRYVKEEFVAAARHKKILASDIGLQDTSRVYVNDHLSAMNKKLLSMVKVKAREKHFSYVWVKYAKIHVRKNDTSPVVIINSQSDLNRLN